MSNPSLHWRFNLDNQPDIPGWILDIADIIDRQHTVDALMHLSKITEAIEQSFVHHNVGNFHICHNCERGSNWSILIGEHSATPNNVG